MAAPRPPRPRPRRLRSCPPVPSPRSGQASPRRDELGGSVGGAKASALPRQPPGKAPTDPEQMLQHLYQRRVLAMPEFRSLCGCSHMTAWRVLRQHGYFTSYNRNARYYTLADIPLFDALGLWAYRNIRFSRYGSLTQTLIALVNRGESGYYARELSNLVGVPAAPALSRLHARASEGRTGTLDAAGRRSHHRGPGRVGLPSRPPARSARQTLVSSRGPHHPPRRASRFHPLRPGEKKRGA